MDAIDSRVQKLMPRFGTNSGHGHVWDRPDCFKAKCGGETKCRKCQTDAAALHAVRKKLGEVE